MSILSLMVGAVTLSASLRKRTFARSSTQPLVKSGALPTVKMSPEAITIAQVISLASTIRCILCLRKERLCRSGEFPIRSAA